MCSRKISGELLYTFQNIFLPDSTTNESASHGFLSYSIQPKDGLGEQTQIRNRAGIYFDFNPPILTNIVVNTLVSKLPTGSDDEFGASKNLLLVKSFPNPFRDFFQIEIALLDPEPLQVEIFDVTGKRVYRDQVRGRSGWQSLSVDGSRFQAGGVYFYRVSGGSDRLRGKTVKIER